MSRVFVTIGPFTVYWYSVLVIIALFIGIHIADNYNKKIQLPGALIMDMVLGLVVSAIFGARLYYVVFNFKKYQDSLIDIFKVWEGGLAIYGAIIAGVIYIYFYCKKRKVSIVKVLDVCSLSLLLGQAIGRWGNFFNSEAYGGITTKQALQSLYIPDFIIKGMYIDGSYRTPTFLYESLWCLLGVIILFFIRRRKYVEGKQISFYLIWYGIGRYFIESLRTDSLYIGDYKISAIVSLVLVLIGIIGWIKIFLGKHKNDNLAQVGNDIGRV